MSFLTFSLLQCMLIFGAQCHDTIEHVVLICTKTKSAFRMEASFQIQLEELIF